MLFKWRVQNGEHNDTWPTLEIFKPFRSIKKCWIYQCVRIRCHMIYSFSIRDPSKSFYVSITKMNSVLLRTTIKTMAALENKVSSWDITYLAVKKSGPTSATITTTWMIVVACRQDVFQWIGGCIMRKKTWITAGRSLAPLSDHGS